MAHVPPGARGDGDLFVELADATSSPHGTPNALLRFRLFSAFGVSSNPPPWGTLAAGGHGHSGTRLGHALVAFAPSD